VQILIKIFNSTHHKIVILMFKNTLMFKFGLNEIVEESKNETNIEEIINEDEPGKPSIKFDCK